jgi:G:T-mismatch repair DNA endonuclease (very short patch repair protein)
MAIFGTDGSSRSKKSGFRRFIGEKKIARNIARDKRNRNALRRKGWQVLSVGARAQKETQSNT